MSVPNISNVLAPPPILKPNLFCRVTELVIQTAIRTLFVFVSILTAAAAFPISFHAVILPVVTLSSTILAAHFYQDLDQMPGVDVSRNLPPLISTDKSSNYLQGIKSGGPNSPFNSSFHFFESIPQISHWFRDGLKPDMNRELFLAFLGGYDLPDQLMFEFNTYAGDSERPILDLFSEFILTYPDRVVQEQFRCIFLLQEAFLSFLGQRESHIFRTAYSEIGREFPSDRLQKDAATIVALTLDLIPDVYKMYIETTYQGNPLLAPRREKIGFLTLEFGEGASFEGMWENCLNDEKNRHTIRFVEPPPFICLQINRFSDRFEKIDIPIEFPDRITVLDRVYRLTSFIEHQGDSMDDGQYIAGRRIGNRKYLFDDENVTLSGPEWDESAQQAYLICYLPV